MILYRPSSGHSLAEFGISIPTAPDRAARILEALRSDPALREREAEWLIGPRAVQMTRDDLLRAHERTYVDRLFTSEVEDVLKAAFELVDVNGRYHRYDPERASRPLSELFDPKLTGLGGTYQACLEALDRGFCFYFGGGAHHAHPDFGHGFCVVNDSAVALRKLQAEGAIRTAWVIDVDAHKGDGTADIFSKDPSVVTLSVHMARGWPLNGRKTRTNDTPNPAFIPSDIDVPIGRGENSEYVPRLAAALEDLADHPLPPADGTDGDDNGGPDLALVLLGADPYEHDELPSTAGLKLTLEQFWERDRLIYDFLSEREIPQAYLMAGGYGARAWEPYPPFLRSVLRERLGINGST